MTSEDKSKQFCSVCKQWLEMAVVPTGDGEDDDGVIWFRCPQCQGFLPKLGGGDAEPEAAADGSATTAGAGSPAEPKATDAADMPWDSPADMLAARDLDLDPDGEALVGELADVDQDEVPVADAAATPATAPEPGAQKPAEPAEPVAEYASLLAELDPATARPYRPWESYEVGECVHHLAWDDCGVVVAREDLPGGRKVIKCYFADAGVVRLIEAAPR